MVFAQKAALAKAQDHELVDIYLKTFEDNLAALKNSISPNLKEQYVEFVKSILKDFEAFYRSGKYFGNSEGGKISIDRTQLLWDLDATMMNKLLESKGLIVDQWDLHFARILHDACWQVLEASRKEGNVAKYKIE